MWPTKVYRNGTISMLLTEEGYATFSEATPTYYYYLKDHQGNNRVVVNQSGTVQQVNHYYPFGGLFGEGLQTSKQPYKYNGKEFDRIEVLSGFGGLDLYDYGTRHYDPAIGRWGNPDPLLEKYYSISPYVYVANNPVRFVDQDGMFFDDYSIDEREKRVRIIKQDEKVDRVFDRNSPKGREIEKGSFDLEKYRAEGYKIETVVPAGMGATDLGLSIFGGEMAAVKIGSWIGKGVSAWKASRAAKAVDATAEVGANVAKEGVKYSDDLIKVAQKLYPDKAGKKELHHPFPKYMGGAEKQTLVPLDASYHQIITNEFYKYWPKKLPGQVKTYPTYQQAQEIMQKIYSKYPLPGN